MNWGLTGVPILGPPSDLGTYHRGLQGQFIEAYRGRSRIFSRGGGGSKVIILKERGEPLKMVILVMHKNFPPKRGGLTAWTPLDPPLA